MFVKYFGLYVGLFMFLGNHEMVLGVIMFGLFWKTISQTFLEENQNLNKEIETDLWDSDLLSIRVVCILKKFHLKVVTVFCVLCFRTNLTQTSQMSLCPQFSC